MCQISVFVEKDGTEELLLEDVTTLRVDPSGVTIATLFEGPREISNTVIRSIDFMAGKVLLQQTG